MLRSLGCEYSRLEKEGILCPVVELVSHYRKSAVYDDLLTVEVAVRERPSAKIIFEYKIYNEKGELLNDGSTTLVFIDTNSGRLTRAPKVILDVFDKSENA